MQYALIGINFVIIKTDSYSNDNSLVLVVVVLSNIFSSKHKQANKKNRNRKEKKL